MDMADEIVVVEWAGANLHSRDEDETELPGGSFRFDGGYEKIEIFFGRDVETSVPFAIDGVEWYEGLVGSHDKWIMIECVELVVKY